MAGRETVEKGLGRQPGAGSARRETSAGLPRLPVGASGTCWARRLAGSIIGLLFLHLVCSVPAAHAESADSTYRTPLAGEAREVVFLGEKVLIPAVDRSDMSAITLGASLLPQRQGDTFALPVAAFYHRRIKEESLARYLVSIFVNELEYDKRMGALELVTQFENHTLPVQQVEVLDGVEVEGTSLYWGTLLGGVGAGWRLPVYPFQVDNDVRVQLLARAGYFYAEPGDDTSEDLWVPPDTPLFGARLRGRYDGMRRNLLELPHQGIAAGFDLDYLYRDRWRELAGTAATGGNRDFLQLSGYLVGAGAVPGLSERHRLLFFLYGGETMQNSGDRFNAFRINGAPFAGEADDFPRPRYSGVIYDSVLATSYAMAAAGYRRELTFFLYLTGFASYLWADRATVREGDRVVFRDKDGAALTVSLDSAFFWDSSLYLAYAWESGVVRNGRSGGGVTLIWNKLF